MRPAALLAAVLAACASAPARGPSAEAPAADEVALTARCGRGLAADCRALGRARLAGALGADDRLAASDLMRGCELGDPSACGDLGVLFAIGRGVPQGDARAAALSRRSCEQGAAVACSNQAALLAEGVGGADQADGAEVRGGRIVRLFRTACDANVPEGCVNLGTALEAGALALRDLPAAGRAFRRACDGGLALGCHRLALLLSERPEVAPDLTATALEAPACRAGIAPACFAVSEKPPSVGPRTPAARLVDDRRSFALGVPGTGGFSPDELATARGATARRTVDEARGAPEALRVQVPEPLRPRLGIAVVGSDAADADDPAVDRLVALRRGQLGQCYEAGRTAGAPRAEAFAVFHVDVDGHPLEVRVATSPADAALEACLAELVAGWEFPASAGVTGPYLVRESFEAAPPGAAPGYAGPGALRPALADPSCVEARLAIPPEYRASTGAVTVKLAVDRAGAPALLHAVTPVPGPILAAVGDALRRCRWTPGADADGRPATLWVTLTVNLPSR